MICFAWLVRVSWSRDQKCVAGVCFLVLLCLFKRNVCLFQDYYRSCGKISYYISMNNRNIKLNKIQKENMNHITQFFLHDYYSNKWLYIFFMRGSYIVYRFLSLCAFFNAFSLLMFEKSTSVMSSVCLVYALEGMITKWTGRYTVFIGRLPKKMRSNWPLA